MEKQAEIITGASGGIERLLHPVALDGWNTSHIDLKRELLIFFFILSFAVLCYLTIISNYFVSDDFSLIERVVQQGMFYSWGESHGGFLRPIIILSYLIDYKFWNLNPVGYHLTNIIFHAIAAYALYIISCSLMDKARYQNGRALSFLAACLFVALPCHSESVSWIAGRTDVIATAFGFMATAVFFFIMRRGSLFLSGLALLLFSLAILTKESIIILPFIWFLLYVYCWRVENARPSNCSLITLGLACFLLIGYFGLRKAMIGHFIGGYGTEQHISLIHIQTLFNIYQYIIRTFLPAFPLRFSDPLPLSAIGFLIGIGVIPAFTLYRKMSLAHHWLIFIFLMGCYLVSLVPVATMKVSIFDTQNERFLYLPSGFACIIAASFIGVIFRSRFIQNSVLVVFVLIFTLTLQWVNTRWVTASILSKEIADEISKMDLDSIVVLNVPDNYQGAYVFHNGLHEAVTLFAGKKAGRQLGCLQAIAYHNLISLQQIIKVDASGASILIDFPSGLDFYEIGQKMFPTKHEGQTLSVFMSNDQRFNKLKFLSFKSGADIPMLQAIAFR